MLFIYRRRLPAKRCVELKTLTGKVLDRTCRGV